jgi:hypothetical protein
MLDKRMTLAEVSTAEMLELQLINSVAPFILCAKLKPLMLIENTRSMKFLHLLKYDDGFGFLLGFICSEGW